MIIKKLGYACTNTILNTQTPRVSSSRSIRKNTFFTSGMTKVGELSIKNLEDLLTILKWNEQRGIKLFRMSSDIFPWKDKWDFEDVPQWGEIQHLLKLIGDYAKKNKMRLTFHPGPFNKLCTKDPKLLKTTIKELETHNTIMDIMGFVPSFYNTINIHIGASYGERKETCKTWCKNWNLLSNNLKKRLTVENDDKKSLYNTGHLYNYVHQEIGIPIMFDFFHYRCNNNNQKNEQEIANLAISTWPTEITPLFHWSESKRIEQDNSKINIRMHSDICYGPLPDYSLTRKIDLMIEAKKHQESIYTLKYKNGKNVHKT